MFVQHPRFHRENRSSYLDKLLVYSGADLDIWISYWFIPALILLISLCLAPLTLSLDHLLAGSVHADFVLLSKTQPASAQALLSTIAGSIIGVAGVSFSITMVAVSFASGSFGPRLIGNFMRDRGNQTSLGVFIGSFIYTLLILREVRSSDSVKYTDTSIAEFVPQLSISFSLFLAIVCMFFLIYFIHHVPETINIERIIARLGDALKDGVSKRFPKQDSGPKKISAIDQNWIEKADPKDAMEIKYVSEGYIQAIDISALQRIADENELLIDLVKRPGAFVTNHSTVMHVWSEGECDTALKKALGSCLATGDLRTINQNIEFVADQLIEIIARALSPGVNDPFTAIACLNWLQVGILAFADADADEDDASHTIGRVHATPLQFDEFVSAIFVKAVPYIRSDQNVMHHTQEMLSFMAENLKDDGHKSAINKATETLGSRAHVD